MKNKRNIKKKIFSAPRVIALGFLLAVLLGSALLSCPFSHHGELSYPDALFVSATSVCVTGLTTVNIGTVFTTAGHVIILLLIQLGGLGFVTFSTLILLLLGRRLTLKNRLLIQNAYSADTMSGFGAMTLDILKATFFIELCGAAAYAFVFVPEFGLKGLWYAFFHAVSAFCNAGIDLFGGDSLVAYRQNIPVNVITMLLIVVSGLGFPVYRELDGIIRRRLGGVRGGEKASVHLKTVLISTAALITGGAIFTFFAERNNPATLGSVGIGQQILDSFFQSVTLRTAGFQTIPQASFRGCSACLYMLMMFIGGSPAGTAGGVKTVTAVIALSSLRANARGDRRVTLFGKTVPDEKVRQATGVILFSFCAFFTATVLLLAFQDCSLTDAVYETASAIGTVGLTRGITPELTVRAKLTVIAAMYLGRIGPITLALSFGGNASAQPERTQAKLIV